MIRESAPGKVNLVLQVGPPRGDGLHEVCSLVASIDLADELVIGEATGGVDEIVCPGVEGPNICAAALEAFREAVPGRGLPPLEVRIEKRIPVAAGLGGGSADAAAVLRAANALAGRPLDDDDLRAVAARVGADVPSQVRPGHALLLGAGEVVEPLPLAPMMLVLVPSTEGLATADVYREADRIGATRERLESERVRALAGEPAEVVAGALENDLEPAALSLRPELGAAIAALREAGAVGARITGSGPTVYGLFPDAGAARTAARRLPYAIVSRIRHN